MIEDFHYVSEMWAGWTIELSHISSHMKSHENRTFTRVLLLENKINRSFRAKQWHFLPEPPKAARVENSHCFARKLRWILFESNRTRVNVIQVSLNMTNYTLRLTKHGTILLSHVWNMGEFYCPMFRELSWLDNLNCPSFHVIWKLTWIVNDAGILIITLPSIIANNNFLKVNQIICRYVSR